MRGSFYRYQAPKLNQLKKSHMSELTPIDVFYKPKPNFSSRILTFYGDCFLISMLVSSLISLGLSMEIDTLGPYISAQSETPISIFAFYLPIHFLVAIGYFSLSYFFNNSATPINRMNKTRVVPYQFVVDGNVKQYQLSAEQSLKRALGNYINLLSFNFLNLVVLIDKDKRSFADIFSSTMIMEEAEFIKVFQAKGAPKYQLSIDIESLSKDNQLSESSDLAA